MNHLTPFVRMTHQSQTYDKLCITHELSPRERTYILQTCHVRAIGRICELLKTLSSHERIIALRRCVVSQVSQLARQLHLRTQQEKTIFLHRVCPNLPISETFGQIDSPSPQDCKLALYRFALVPQLITLMPRLDDDDHQFILRSTPAYNIVDIFPVLTNPSPQARQIALLLCAAEHLPKLYELFDSPTPDEIRLFHWRIHTCVDSCLGYCGYNETTIRDRNIPLRARSPIHHGPSYPIHWDIDYTPPPALANSPLYKAHGAEIWGIIKNIPDPTPIEREYALACVHRNLIFETFEVLRHKGEISPTERFITIIRDIYYREHVYARLDNITAHERMILVSSGTRYLESILPLTPHEIYVAFLCTSIHEHHRLMRMISTYPSYHEELLDCTWFYDKSNLYPYFPNPDAATRYAYITMASFNYLDTLDHVENPDEQEQELIQWKKDIGGTDDRDDFYYDPSDSEHDI